jgi:hypothetical protein
MTNDFANISAESDLRDMIALRIEDFVGPIPESWGGEPQHDDGPIMPEPRADSWMESLVGLI